MLQKKLLISRTIRIYNYKLIWNISVALYFLLIMITSNLLSFCISKNLISSYSLVSISIFLWVARLIYYFSSDPWTKNQSKQTQSYEEIYHQKYFKILISIFIFTWQFDLFEKYKINRVLINMQYSINNLLLLMDGICINEDS